MGLQLVQRPPVEQLNFDGTPFYSRTTDVEQLNFDGTPFYKKPELPMELEKQVEPEKQGLAERVWDEALYAASLTQVKVADACEYLEREGGKIAAHAALAGLAIAGAAGLVVHESTPVEAASISFGRNIYVNFNRSETQKIENLKDNYGTALDYAGIGCGFIGNRALAVACGATAYYKKQQFNHAVDEAKARGECLQFVQPYWAAGSPVTNWFSVTSCPRIPGGKENGLPVA